MKLTYFFAVYLFRSSNNNVCAFHSTSVATLKKRDVIKGVLTPTLQPVCNWFATRKKLKSQRGCKGRGKVFFKSPTSRRLKSVASCLLNMHKRLAATEFDREEVA